MRPRQVVEAISGLMVAMFVVLISSTVVATPMPVIMADLHGTNSDYTWVLVAAFLSMTVATPVWGKLSDIFNRKLLLQLALAIFIVGTVAAGFAGQIGGEAHTGGPAWLIGWRLFQGIGTGGLMALGQVVIADIIAPRERGKYMGIMGAVMAVGQIGGPLLGGLIADSIGWEWCFFVCVPIGIVAFIMLQATLHITPHPRPIKIDYIGGALLIGGISLILVWISLAGKESAGGFAWDSGTSWLLGGLGIGATIAAIIVELIVKEPIVPLRLFAKRTFALASVASVAVGITMFGTSVFLSQYLQYSRGMTPTDSGLATIPMVIGSMAGGIVIGQLISRTGKWKGYVIGGAVVLILGLALMSTIHANTSIWLVWLYMLFLGLGAGVLMQNMVLVTQNSLPATLLGAASGAVTFFRSLGGTVGVTVLGTILGTTVADKVAGGMRELGIDTSAATSGGAGADIDPSQLTDLIAQFPAGTSADQIVAALSQQSPGAIADPDALRGVIELLINDPSCADSLGTLTTGQVPNIVELCQPIREVMENSYGDSIAFLFFLVVPVAVITLLCTIFLPNLPLSRKTAVQQIEEELGAELAALEPAELGGEGYHELVATGAISVVPEGEGRRPREDEESRP